MWAVCQSVYSGSVPSHTKKRFEKLAYFRKRGSASYIVRQVREREIQRERRK